MVEVIAQPRVVELRLACGTRARFRGPVHPDEEGRFQLAGRATHFYGSFGVELAGQVQGARLSVTLTQIYEGSRETTEEELLAGVTPDFPGIVCLAGGVT